MSGKYIEKLQHQYYVSEGENPEDGADGALNYKEQMMLNNRIEGLLPLRIESMNNRKDYYYCTDGLQPLNRLLDSHVLNSVFISSLICKTISAIELSFEYLLSEDDFVLEPSSVFSNGEANEVGLVYLPGYCKDLRSQLQSLLEYLMTRLDYADKNAAYITYSVYAKCKKEGVTLKEIAEEAEKWHLGGDMESVQDTVLYEEANECVQAVKETVEPAQKESRFKTWIKSKMAEVMLIKNRLREEPEEAATAKTDSEALAVLEGETESFDILNVPFIIGKCEEQCGLYINAPEISRFHAQIRIASDSFAIVDLNSEKGTYLNGVRLEPGSEEAIMDGDILKFASYRYVFHCKEVNSHS